MAEERLKILEERLTRIEAALTQRPSATGTGGGGGGGFTLPGGTVSDPAPWPGNWQFINRAMIDPVPWLQWLRPRWPTPVVDPGPFPTPVVDPAPWPNPIVDPAVLAQFAQVAQANLASRIGKVADPAPPDIGRLNISQLEATIHSIAAERARLDSMESMVKKQIDALKQQQKPG